jgi:hypothetical protein
VLLGVWVFERAFCVFEVMRRGRAKLQRNEWMDGWLPGILCACIFSKAETETGRIQRHVMKKDDDCFRLFVLPLFTDG